MPSPERIARENLYSTLDGSGWIVLVEELGRRIKTMSIPLLSNPDLPEAERRGYVYAIREIQGGIRAVYEKAAREIPPHIQQDLGMNE